MNLQDFYQQLTDAGDVNVSVSGPTFVVTFENSKEKEFPLDLQTLIAFLRYLLAHQQKCIDAWSAVPSRKGAFTVYEEKSYRAIYALVGEIPGLTALSATGGSQTKGLTHVLSTLIAFLGELQFEGIETNTLFDSGSVKKAVDRIPASFAHLERMILKGQQEGSPAVSDSSAVKKAFHSWLIEKRGVAESTASKYSGTSITTADEDHRKRHPGFVGLYSLQTPDAVERVIAELHASESWQRKNLDGNNMYSVGVNHYKAFISEYSDQVVLPKPFVLLAGISGTGKTRFVREQAARAVDGSENYLLVPVRPDWHEPSDILGFVSRINGTRFIATPLLTFMAKAWRATNCNITPEGYQLTNANSTVTHWLCLDEMNLAPVEQYFSDFLAVMETRSWRGEVYSCSPILPLHALALPIDALDGLRVELGFDEADPLWAHFAKYGMPLPPNLVVAGTVNMDETAHGFSRKVIDRAFTIDFGEFFPNDFSEYFAPNAKAVTLSFPRWSNVQESDLAAVKADPDGKRSIAFLSGVNEVLKQSPFSLAFRALNELLVALKCFSPESDTQLAAVWDDYLMTKLLPRMEGDAEKMDFAGSGASLLTRLREYVDAQLSSLTEQRKRPDLLRRSAVPSSMPIDVELRTPRALSRMQLRLERHNFTSFWP